jgi:serine protease Do
VSRSTLLRAALIAGTAAALLAGCVAPPVVVVETAKPEDPDFGTIGGESPVPIETGEPIEPTEPSTAGYTALLDDLGVVTVSVPSDWDDVDGAPFTTDAGQEWASIFAAPDIQGYLESWDVPGIEIAATAAPGVTDEQLLGLLESISAQYGSCGTVVQEASPYDDGFYTGFESAWEDCGTNGTAAFALTVVSTAGDQAVFLRAQVTTDYDANEVYTQVANSFDTKVGRSQVRQ